MKVKKRLPFFLALVLMAVLAACWAEKAPENVMQQVDLPGNYVGFEECPVMPTPDSTVGTENILETTSELFGVKKIEYRYSIDEEKQFLEYINCLSESNLKTEARKDGSYDVFYGGSAVANVEVDGGELTVHLVAED